MEAKYIEFVGVAGSGKTTAVNIFIEEANKIKMPAPLSDDLIEYTDGTKATAEQMSKDVTNFLMWSAEPHLEQRHKTGFRVISYLIILTILVYFTMKKIWSRVEPKV